MQEGGRALRLGRLTKEMPKKQTQTMQGASSVAARRPSTAAAWL